MSNTPVQLSGRWPLAAVILATLTATATAGSFMRGCAARDMLVLRLIEDRESTRAVSADQLRDVMLSIMHSQIVCHEGHVLDALAIYDGVAQSITPQPTLSGRSRPIQVQ
jgi:hypothetical protein